MAIKDYSATPALNGTISGINVAEGCPPSGINDAIRQLMADLKGADFGTGGLKADVIQESTSGSGVTIDTLLIKDGGFPNLPVVQCPDTVTDGAVVVFSGTSGRLVSSGAAPAVRAYLGLSNAALLPVGTTAGTVAAGDDPRFSSGADNAARDLAVFNSFLNQIDLGRASGAIPSGFMHLFLTDELATKTNATYDSTGDYYHNPSGYTDETANISSIAQINFNQGGTCTLTALRDGTLTGGCGTQDETGSSVDLIFSASKSIGKIEFYNYANTERLKAFTVRRYNAGAWTKVPITAITGGTIINTDEGQVNNANGWVVCEFASVSDTQFRLAFTSVWGIGDANAYLPEAKIYSLAGAANMTLIPTAITAGSAPETVDIYMLHKAVDATTLNTDLKARVSRDNGSNWSAHVTLAEVCQYDADYKLLKGTADLSALASGTSVKWEITTLNSKGQRVRAAAMILNS